jgi:hypothetical protein
VVRGEFFQKKWVGLFNVLNYIPAGVVVVAKRQGRGDKNRVVDNKHGVVAIFLEREPVDSIVEGAAYGFGGRRVFDVVVNESVFVGGAVRIVVVHAGRFLDSVDRQNSRGTQVFSLIYFRLLHSLTLVVILHTLYVIPLQPSAVFSTLFATMTDRSSPSIARGGRGRGYRPGTMTFDNPMAPVPEGTNENSPTEIDNPISIHMEFTPTAETRILKILSSFLDALSEADHLATLYNTKQT